MTKRLASTAPSLAGISRRGESHPYSTCPSHNSWARAFREKSTAWSSAEEAPVLFCLSDVPAEVFYAPGTRVTQNSASRQILGWLKAAPLIHSPAPSTKPDAPRDQSSQPCTLQCLLLQPGKQTGKAALATENRVIYYGSFVISIPEAGFKQVKVK